jgi:hypothetical protein
MMSDSLKEIQDLDKADVKISEKDFVDEHKKLLDVLEHPTKKKLKEEAKDQGKELKEELAKAPIAYHGSTVPFEEHAKPKKDPKSQLNYGPGIYYATDPEEASSYAEPQIARINDHSSALTEVQKEPGYREYRDSVASKMGLSSSVDTKHKNWDKFADHMLSYDKQKINEKLKLAPNVRRSDVQVNKPFDPYNKKHALAVYQALGIEPDHFRLGQEHKAGSNLYGQIANHDKFDNLKWGEKTHKVNQAIKRAGFDGIHDKKLGHIIAFDPKQIKPAYGAAKKPKKLAASELEKSKNVREQRKKVFGTDANAPRTSEKRMKMMQMIRQYAQKKYGLPLVTASGKRDESGKLKEQKGIEGQPYDVFTPKGVAQEKKRLAQIKEKGTKRVDPKPDWRSGQLETQPSPDAAVHELSHLDLAPEGMTAPKFQTEMDRLWGDSQSKYGHMQQKKTRGEIQPMSIENPIRREMGLPANKQTKPVTANQSVLDDPTGKEKRFVEGKDANGKKAFYDRQSRLQNQDTKDRRQQIQEGSLKFHPEKGWQQASDTNALINLRGRGLKEEAANRLKARLGFQSQPKKLAASEDLKKEQWERKRTGSSLNPLHGVISPEGKFYPMNADEMHSNKIIQASLPPYAKVSYTPGELENEVNKKMGEGWISVGTAGEPSFIGHSSVLSNPRHPATAALRGLIREAQNDPKNTAGFWTGHVEVSHSDKKPIKGAETLEHAPHVGYVSADHFVRHGTFKPHKDLGRSEIEKSWSAKLAAKYKAQRPQTPQEIKESKEKHKKAMEAALAAIDKIKKPTKPGGQK